MTEAEALSPALRERIETLVKSDRVVLFMKGVRDAPQCGFSATVCRILDAALPAYTTVNVLEDKHLREGIKHYASWPTIPQLYVGGEFVGGCDIIEEMAGDGTLLETLGVPSKKVDASAVRIEISDDAARALTDLAAQQEAGRALHLRVDARFQNGLFFGAVEAGEAAVTANGVTLHLDAPSLARANGLRIHAVETESGAGFRIENPNAPAVATVQPITPRELKAWLDSGRPLELYDVRGADERAIAHIPGARLLDEARRHGARSARAGHARSFSTVTTAGAAAKWRSASSHLVLPTCGIWKAALTRGRKALTRACGGTEWRCKL